MNFKQFVLLLVIALAVMGCTQPSDSPVLVAAGDPSKYPRCAGSVEPHKCEALEKNSKMNRPKLLRIESPNSIRSVQRTWSLLTQLQLLRCNRPNLL